MNRLDDFPNYPTDESGDILEPYCLWHLAVVPDDGETYLWDMNGAMISCDVFGEFPQLDSRFSAWSKKHQVIFNRRWETGDFKQHHVSEGYIESLYQDGLKLCAELAEAATGQCHTIDFRPTGREPKRFLVPEPPEDPNPRHSREPQC